MEMMGVLDKMFDVLWFFLPELNVSTFPRYFWRLFVICQVCAMLL